MEAGSITGSASFLLPCYNEVSAVMHIDYITGGKGL